MDHLVVLKTQDFEKQYPILVLIKYLYFNIQKFQWLYDYFIYCKCQFRKFGLSFQAYLSMLVIYVHSFLVKSKMFSVYFIITYPCSHYYKSMLQLLHIHVPIITYPCSHYYISMFQLLHIHVPIITYPCSHCSHYYIFMFQLLHIHVSILTYPCFNYYISIWIFTCI